MRWISFLGFVNGGVGGVERYKGLEGLWGGLLAWYGIVVHGIECNYPVQER